MSHIPVEVVSRHRKNIQRFRADGPFGIMHEPPDFFRRLARERSFAAMLADLRGDVLHQHAAVFKGENFADEFGLGGGVAADMALKHGYLRFRFSIHSFGSGS